MDHTTDSQPSYYAVIPASVRYDKSLTANAKLLYGEITALCHKEGYCWASNRYLADLYGVKIRVVQYWITSLVKAGHIVLHLTSASKGQEASRKLSIVQGVQGVMQEKALGHARKIIPNNTYTITNKRNIYIATQKNDELVEQAQDIIHHFNTTMGTSYKNVSIWVDNFKKWRTIYSIDDIKQAITKIPTDQYWQDKMTIVMLFRTKNPSHEAVDYIGQLLNIKEVKKPGMFDKFTFIT